MINKCTRCISTLVGCVTNYLSPRNVVKSDYSLLRFVNDRSVLKFPMIIISLFFDETCSIKPSNRSVFSARSAGFLYKVPIKNDLTFLGVQAISIQ